MFVLATCFLLLILLFALRFAHPPDPRYAASFTHVYRPFQASLLGTARYLLGLWENYAPFRGPQKQAHAPHRSGFVSAKFSSR